MAEIGTVKFYRENLDYGFIVPERGGKDVYFRMASVRIPRVDGDGSNFGYAFPGDSQPRFPQSGDKVVFVRVVDKGGNHRVVRWAYEDAHEAAMEILWGLLAARLYPSR